MILGGTRGMLHHGPLRMHFLHSGARIRVFEQNRKHKSPLKLFRIQGRFFLFFMNKSWPIHYALVSW